MDELSVRLGCCTCNCSCGPPAEHVDKIRGPAFELKLEAKNPENTENEWFLKYISSDCL